LLFLAYCVFTIIDLVLDWDEADAFHKAVEVIMAGLSIAITYSFTRAYREGQAENQTLSEQLRDQAELERERERWKQESEKWKSGIAASIDRQLGDWKLTVAEKEVALLLLKGLSLKEISVVRSVAEKTARAQSLAIYAKSGLHGRAEFSAFFLEDVLVLPSSTQAPGERPIVG